MNTLLSLLLFAAVDPAAVVMVQDAPNAKGEMNTGTGTVIAISDAKTPVATILTCAHVSETGQPLTVDYKQGGFRVKAKTIAIDKARDYAILEAYVPRGWTAVIPVGYEYPKPGETVELYGYPWTAQGQRVRKSLRFDGFCKDGFHDNWISLQAGAISGDSGGPIVFNDTVIGVLSGSALDPQTRRELNSHGPWVGLMDKKFFQCCQQPSGGFVGVGVGRLRLPMPPQQVQPTQPVRDPALQAWLTEVRDQLVQVNQRLDGIKSCECGERAVITAEEVAAVLVEKYPDRIRGPKGDKGDSGSDGATPSTGNGITHAVLVVDRSAAYWPRLSVALERARQRFNGIRIAPPPEFATQLPAIVFYENGKPVLVRKGERDVTHTLTAIERGDLSFLQES